MSYMLIRVLIFILIFGAIFLGARRIWRDWKNQFKAVDKARQEADIKERERPDVIELKRNKDGVYRPGDGGDTRD
jgi:cytoskeletal protein RodZ